MVGKNKLDQAINLVKEEESKLCQEIQDEIAKGSQNREFITHHSANLRYHGPGPLSPGSLDFELFITVASICSVYQLRRLQRLEDCQDFLKRKVKLFSLSQVLQDKTCNERIPLGEIFKKCKKARTLIDHYMWDLWFHECDVCYAGFFKELSEIRNGPKRNDYPPENSPTTEETDTQAPALEVSAVPSKPPMSVSDDSAALDRTRKRLRASTLSSSGSPEDHPVTTSEENLRESPMVEATIKMSVALAFKSHCGLWLPETCIDKMKTVESWGRSDEKTTTSVRGHVLTNNTIAFEVDLGKASKHETSEFVSEVKRRYNSQCQVRDIVTTQVWITLPKSAGQEVLDMIYFSPRHHLLPDPSLV